MDLRTVVAEVVSNLAVLNFVESFNIQIEALTVKGRAHLRQRGFLEIYFNERTQTVAVAWIEGERRRWGIDRDNLRGWHRHPIDNPEGHEEIPAMSISEIIREFGVAWGRGT